MLYFRACPRCHGDMQARDDMYGPYRECLQCGHVHYIGRTPTEREDLAKQLGRPSKGREAA